MRKTFHVQLAEAEGVCVELSGHALVQLHRALEAVRTQDPELADRVIAGDDLVDGFYIDLEQRILTLLATQAPVASDLRLVSAMLHINIALERVGDLCVNISKTVKLARELPPSEQMLNTLQEMGAQAGRLVETAMQSFTRRDLSLALRVASMDEPISRLNRQLIEEVVSHRGDGTASGWATRMIFVSRWLERIGDHAVDIAEQVAFLVTGQMHEFTDASHKADL